MKIIKKEGGFIDKYTEIFILQKNAGKRYSRRITYNL